MDSKDYYMQIAQDSQLFECCQKEFEIKKHDSDTIVDPNAAWWIGFIYRAIIILFEIHSKDLFNLLPLKQMFILYPGFHTISEESALEQIAQSIGLI